MRWRRKKNVVPCPHDRDNATIDERCWSRRSKQNSWTDDVSSCFKQLWFCGSHVCDTLTSTSQHHRYRSVFVAYGVVLVCVTFNEDEVVNTLETHRNVHVRPVRYSLFFDFIEKSHDFSHQSATASNVSARLRSSRWIQPDLRLTRCHPSRIPMRGFVSFLRHRFAQLARLCE